MTGSIVARRYAKALFNLEKKSGIAALEQCAKDLEALTQCLDSSTELEAFFSNPIFSAHEKCTVIVALSDRVKAETTTRNFCFLLADKGRLAQLRGITREYQSMLDAEKGILRGELVTAIPLDDSKRSAMLVQLQKQAGRPLDLAFTVDAAVLGGMLLKVGDKVLDASLRAQLSLLKDTIKRGEQDYAD